MEISAHTSIGRLTVIDAFFNQDDYGNRIALVECECGTRKPVLVMNLKSGRTKSCGLCTRRGGARPKPYKPRKVATPSRKASPVTTESVAVIGKACDA